MDNASQNKESLLNTFAGYYNEKKYYKAMALALDNFAAVDDFSDALTQEANPGDLIGILLLFCQENDRDRAIEYATILIDLYKQNDYPEKIIEISYHFIAKFDDAFANTIFQVIMKEGMFAVINLLERIDDAVPEEKIMVMICSTMLCFPGLAIREHSFAMSVIEKLVPHYKSHSEARIYVIACFLPYIKNGFERLMSQWDGLNDIKGIDSSDIDEQLRTIKLYMERLFPQNYPVLKTDNPYEVEANRDWQNEYIEMMKAQESLRRELRTINDKDAFFSSNLKVRFDKLLIYYMNADLKFDDVEIVRTYHIIMCYAMCRFVDLDYTINNIRPYAKSFMNYKVNNFTYANTLYSMQTAAQILGEVYELTRDDISQYEAYVKFLELGNLHLKRVCFENGLDNLVEVVKSGYAEIHSVAAKALQIVFDYELSPSVLYLEIAKRKNLLYLAEMWQRQGVNVIEIKKLIERDFTLEELQSSIGNGRTLVDFVYVRSDVGDRGLDISNFTCLAFIVSAIGEVDVKGVDVGARLSEHIKDYENSTMYFKSIAEHILLPITGAETLLVCADGDINQLSIAALPYEDGYVTNYFAVRNIGSVMDIVYPNKKKPIKSALLFTNPAYGSDGRWAYLKWSELEGKVVKDELVNTPNISVTHLSGATADKQNLLSNLDTGYDVLHISSHGVAVDEGMAIIAAGANASPNSSLVLDSDISNKNFTNTSLAVFAICYGAEQTVALQDNLSGFIKGSLLSGVNTIIAPIKPIDDLSSVVIINEFYKCYLSEGCVYSGNAEQSLREAVQRTRKLTKQQLKREYFIQYNLGVSREEAFPFDDPQYWGAWVCFSKQEAGGVY
ncbi:MAG: CHAT domain-containing protein [Defluviitaleaceae bacterium]|nr:CHAT domain-containing protein [Defluviitaleaceae bacterium]MCL2274043.1 CHAT domain-containing protein [Defluviitaleaceae bacterium]